MNHSKDKVRSLFTGTERKDLEQTQDLYFWKQPVCQHA